MDTDQILLNYLKKAPVVRRNATDGIDDGGDTNSVYEANVFPCLQVDDEIIQVVRNKQARVDNVDVKRRKIEELRNLGARMREDAVEFFEITRDLQEDSAGQDSS